MKHNVISAKQMHAVVSFFLFGSSLITGASTVAKQDTWVCVIFGFLLSIPMMLVHAGILDLYPGRSYYGNIIKIYGRLGGRIVVFLLSLFALYLGGLVLRTFSEFIHVVNMTGTPLVAISAFIIGTAVCVLENRIYTVARISKFVLPIVIVSIFITLGLSIQDIDLDNIKPFLGSGFSNIMQGTTLFLVLPFGEIGACAPVFEGLDRKKKIFPVFLYGAVSGFLTIFVANIRNLLVLGYSAQIYPFASYQSVSVITYGEFFTRIEVLIGINLLLAGFIKVCVLIYSAASGFTKIFGLDDYVPLLAPCGLLVFMITLTVHSNMDEMFDWLKYLPALALPVQVVLPVVTLVVGYARKKLSGKKRPPRRKAEGANKSSSSAETEETAPQPE